MSGILKRIVDSMLKHIGNFLSPIVYLSVWYVFLLLASKYIPFAQKDPDLFSVLSFLILLSGLITRSTVWSIGHKQFGIKGSSRSRIINFHNGDFWFDLYGDSPMLEKEKTKGFIRTLIDKSKTEE